MNEFTLDQTPMPVVQRSTTEMAVIDCNGLHATSQEFIARGCTLAVILGYRLSQLKQSLPHGEFGKLFKNGTPCRFDFQPRAARNYMKLFKLFAVKLKGDARNALCARCANGTPESVAELLKEKFPDISTIRQALLALDDSKKETGTYDQFDTEKEDVADNEEVSPEAQAQLRQMEFGKLLVNMETFVQKQAAVIPPADRIMLANQLAKLADELIRL